MIRLRSRLWFMLRRACPRRGGVLCSRSTEIVDLEWPQPEREAREHSERLIAHLRELIGEAGGWISFAQYMDAVLYAPGLGYYSAGAAKFGSAGDFVTAPEVSALFSRSVANQCAQVLLASGGDTIVEPGAGSGSMAAQILSALADLDSLPDAYLIVEPSAELRDRQAATLRAHDESLIDRVRWLDSPPPRFDGVLIGNEVLDALPCERFVIDGDEVMSLGVSYDDGRFVATPAEAGETLTRSVRDIEQHIGRSFASGYQSEVRPALGPFIADWASRLRRGALLWLDYGCSRKEYYSAERATGTLLCHYRHRAHDDPFVYPGLQDVTAWIDFTAVAEAAVEAGLAVNGYTTQAHFLVGCGIENQFSMLRSQLDDPADQARLSGEVQKLLMPGQMGERFRVIGLDRELECRMLGFSMRDLAASL